MKYTYKTKGCCATQINFEVEGNIIKEVEFIQGCRGNTQGIARLLVGMEVEEAIKRLKGIPCRGETSCPDQLALALEELVLNK
ncbi:TIGR03905 family TSCPD domain-containing protein [Clostridium senegalense]|uniref:TIGR03905 family TSCPD domain-containing protein n=1 Tax=Clostridium senegalense TaxID=1465809 RepID=UPI0002881A69|nr:TIGR03905 family TSCPD domain-containing protein [Clostridium senegalense]MBU5226328.1 TIGR03905 family TSCPD domain-containing protein [Clostridium senegalense]